MRSPVAVLLLSIFLLLTVSCCDDVPSGTGDDKPGLQRGDTAVSTLVVYMMAENSLAPYADVDIAEIRRGTVSLPSDCRLFVFVDDRDNPRLLKFVNNSGVCEEKVLYPFADDFCSSDATAFGAVLAGVLNDYPTHSLDLVMWSHGNGWLLDKSRAGAMRTIGVDNGKNSYSDRTVGAIEIEELAAVIKELPAKVNRLMFDACFMQGSEVAYALRNAVQWVIGSPAEIPGDGAPYDTVIGEFFVSDGVKGIIDSYKTAYEGGEMGVVLSAAYMPAMQRLADATYSNVCTYFNTSKKREYIDVFAYLPGGAKGLYGYMPCYYDINAVMKKYLAEPEYVAWKEALDEAVPYVVTTGNWYSAYVGKHLPVDTSVYCGMSIYMPQTTSRYSQLNIDFSNTEWYSAAGWDAAGW